MTALSLPLWVIQKGVAGLLLPDPILAGQLAKDMRNPQAPKPAIFDGVAPLKQAFPYVVLGDGSTEEPRDTFSHPMWEIWYQINIWSQYQGFQEALSISYSVWRLLHRQPLPASDGITPFGLYHQNTQLLTDEDGVTRHAVMRFHVFASG